MTITATAAAQSELYRYLSEGFRLPDPERLAYLASRTGAGQAACAAMVAAGEAGAPAPDQAILGQAVAGAQAGSLPELQRAYVRLFGAGTPRPPCQPVESVQREGRLAGEAGAGVDLTCQRYGFDIIGDRQPDHLAVELEFLARSSWPWPTCWTGCWPPRRPWQPECPPLPAGRLRPAAGFAGGSDRRTMPRPGAGRKEAKPTLPNCRKVVFSFP